jgi:hypothetical protein
MASKTVVTLTARVGKPQGCGVRGATPSAGEIPTYPTRYRRKSPVAVSGLVQPLGVVGSHPSLSYVPALVALATAAQAEVQALACLPRRLALRRIDQAAPAPIIAGIS